MLTIWKDKFDREATWEKIVIALRKTGNKQLAREMEEQFVQLEKQALNEIGILYIYNILKPPSVKWCYYHLQYLTTDQAEHTVPKAEARILFDYYCYVL